MNINPLMLTYVKEEKPIVCSHEHELTKDHVPNDFRAIKIGKKTVIGLPMKEWFLKPLEGTMHLIGHLPLVPQKVKDTVHNTRAFLDMLDNDSSMETFEKSLSYEDGPSIHNILMMDMRKGVRGVMNKSIDEQAKELIAVRARYPHRVLISWAIDPNQPDMYEKAINALEVLKFNAIKVYPNLGYKPTHPALMKLLAYCEKNDVQVITHCSAANMHRPLWDYRVYGKELVDGNWVDVDKNIKVKNAEELARIFNHPQEWIPVLEAFPKLRLNIAHFAGCDWDNYLKGKPGNWVQVIIDLVTKYENCYTDFSYSFSIKSHLIGLIKLMQTNSAVAKKVLYGTDFFMVLLEGDYGKLKKEFLDTLPSDIKQLMCFDNPVRYWKLAA